MATTSTILNFLGFDAYLNPEQAVVIIMVAVSALSLITLLISQKRTRFLHQKIDRLQHDLRVANSGAIGMGQQLLAVEKQLHADRSIHSAHTNSVNVSSTIESHKQALQAQSAVLYSNSLQENISQHEPYTESAAQQGDDDDAIYQTARQLLNQGLDVDAVIKKSGLSHAEVSLINTLNRQGINAANNKKNRLHNNIHSLSTPS